MVIDPNDLVEFCAWFATLCAIFGLGAGICDSILRKRSKDE